MVSTLLGMLKKERGKSVRNVKINIGELQQIDREIFEFALEEQAKGTALEGFKPIFREERAVFKCGACHREWCFQEAKSGLNNDMRKSVHLSPELVHAFIKCPTCGSPDFEVVRGKGISIVEVEMDDFMEQVQQSKV